MEIELYKKLNKNDEFSVQTLIAACNTADGSGYDTVLDADFYYLIRNTDPKESGCDTEIISLLCGYRLGETLNGVDMLELQAFTHPSLRQLGFFTLCFNSFRDDFRGFAIKFMVKGAAAQETLEALGASFQYEELFMGKRLSRGISNPDDTLCTKQGCVYLTPYGEDTLYLHSLLVYDSHRGKGYGEQIMRSLEACPPGPYTRVLLQVASDNLPAVSLYEKLGYTVMDRVSYWTLPA